jgi:hypothetical protein
MSREFPQSCVAAICGATLSARQSAAAAGGTDRVRRGGMRMALVIGLVAMVVIWLIVIYGSSYVNKNVQ